MNEVVLDHALWQGLEERKLNRVHSAANAASLDPKPTFVDHVLDFVDIRLGMTSFSETKRENNGAQQGLMPSHALPMQPAGESSPPIKRSA